LKSRWENRKEISHAERKQEENVGGPDRFLDTLHKTGKIKGRRKVSYK